MCFLRLLRDFEIRANANIHRVFFFIFYPIFVIIPYKGIEIFKITVILKLF